MIKEFYSLGVVVGMIFKWYIQKAQSIVQKWQNKQVRSKKERRVIFPHSSVILPHLNKLKRPKTLNASDERLNICWVQGQFGFLMAHFSILVWK